MNETQTTTTARIGIVGTGFVADLYMRSLKTFPNIAVAAAFDIDGKRLQAFRGEGVGHGLCNPRELRRSMPVIDHSINCFDLSM